MEASAAVREPVTFVIIGKGPLYGPIRRYVAAHGLSDRVELHAALSTPEVIRQLQRATLFVLPSRLESYPRVVVEAAACGVPTALPDIPLYDLFKDGGFTLPYRDPAELPGVIADYVVDRPRQTTLSRRAREYALAHNSYEAVTSQIVRLYEQLGA